MQRKPYRRINILLCVILLALIPATCSSLLYAIDREVEIREQRTSDFCRTHPAQCDLARKVAKPMAAGGV